MGRDSSLLFVIPLFPLPLLVSVLDAAVAWVDGQDRAGVEAKPHHWVTVNFVPWYFVLLYATRMN